jgi:hypothetical protein
MKPPRFSLAELLLAVAFLGLSTALVRAFGGDFFLHGLAMSAAVLFLTYLLLVIVLRQRRERSGAGRDA